MSNSLFLRSASSRAAVVLPGRIRLGAGIATLLACAAAGDLAAATTGIGDFDVRVFNSAPADSRLPVELRETHAPPLMAHGDLLNVAADRDVEIRWTGRENATLSAYRVTATIDGGALSGLATQWTVAAGRGTEAAAGARVYRLRLPVHAAGAVRLHAALEAVRADGSRVLLAVLESEPRAAELPRSARYRIASGSVAFRNVGVVPVGKVLRPALAGALEAPPGLRPRFESLQHLRSTESAQRQSRAPPSA